MSLYKYVVPHLWENILKDGFIRFTQPSDFNDPFEMQPYFEYVETESNIRKEIQDLLDSESGKEMWNAGLQINYSGIPAEARGGLTFESHKKRVEDGIRENIPEILIVAEQIINQMSNKDGQLIAAVRDQFLLINKWIGVLSLTEKRDNLLMWAHYAQNHQGFVIEFDDTHEYFHQTAPIPPLRFLLDPHSTSTQSNEQWDAIEKSAKTFSSRTENLQNQDTSLQSQDADESYIGRLLKVIYPAERPNRTSFKDITATDMLLVKSKEWEYEQEWRMLRFLYKPDKTISKEGESIHLFSFPPSCIKGIIFGCHMPSSVEEDISKFIMSDGRYSHVRRYKAVLDEKRFGLNIISNGS
jgi:hypothetical protein